MLTRNCALNNLLHESDFNVRVTVYDPTKASKDSKKQKSAWIEAIRDSIGGGIVNSPEQYQMDIQHGSEIAHGTVAGKNIAKIIDIMFDSPQPIRITLKALDAPQSRVWIIV